VNDIEELLKLFRKYNVKVADWANGQLYKVEFFPPTSDEGSIESTPVDETPDEATGLTPSESRALLGMPK
jgi:hypothetical protein